MWTVFLRSSIDDCKIRPPSVAEHIYMTAKLNAIDSGRPSTPSHHITPVNLASQFWMFCHRCSKFAEQTRSPLPIPWPVLSARRRAHGVYRRFAMILRHGLECWHPKACHKYLVLPQKKMDRISVDGDVSHVTKFRYCHEGQRFNIGPHETQSDGDDCQSMQRRTVNIGIMYGVKCSRRK